MTVKIDKKIVKYSVADAAAVAEQPQESNVVQMHEKVERPDVLIGSTYKVKTPLSEHALYITINDMVLNPGTEHELRRPFEIFINSKNMDHFQWVTALTLIMSAVFRKGGDVTFLVEELRSVFDPKGGYFKKGGKFMPSIVAEIGDVIETHLRSIGLIQDTVLDEHQQRLIEEKRAEYESQQRSAGDLVNDAGDAGDTGGDNGDYPEGSTLCGKCSTRAVVLLDGCMTCLSCGDSKCG